MFCIPDVAKLVAGFAYVFRVFDRRSTFIELGVELGQEVWLHLHT